MNKRQQKKIRKPSKTKQLRTELEFALKIQEVLCTENAQISKLYDDLQLRYDLKTESIKNLKAELDNYRRNQKVSYFTKEVAIPKMSLMFKGDAKLEARKVLIDAIAQNEEIFELKETDTLLIYKLTCIKRLD